MAAVLGLKAAIYSYQPSPKINLSFRLQREGEATTREKFLRLYRGLESLEQVVLVFWAEEGDGQFTQVCYVDLAAFLDQGDWLAIGSDNAPPHKVRMAYLALTESGTYTFNITSGEGGGGGVDGYTLRSGDRLLVIDAAGTVVGLTPTP